MTSRRSFPEFQALITSLSSIIRESRALGSQFETTLLTAFRNWLDFQTGAEPETNEFIVDQFRNYSQILQQRQESLAPHLKSAETVLAQFAEFRAQFDDALKKQKEAGASRLAFERAKQASMDNAVGRRASFYEEQRDRARSEMTDRIAQANDARDEIVAADYRYRNGVAGFLRDLTEGIAKDFEGTVSNAMDSLEKGQELIASFEIAPDPKVKELQELLESIEAREV